MPSQEIITYELDVRSTLAALNTLNQGITSSEDKLTSHNQKLAEAFAKVSGDLVKFSDKATQSQERFLKSLERQADLAGKSGTERLIADRDRLTKKFGDNEAAINRITAAYNKMIAAEHGSGSGSLATFGTTVKSFIENPLQGAGVGAAGLLEKLGPVGLGLTGVATAAVAMGAALFEVTHRFAESSEQLTNLATATGISVNDLDRLTAMSKIVGTDISTLSRASAKMAEELEHGGTKAAALESTLNRLHVSTVNVNGATRDEGDILVDVLGKLSKVTDEHTRLALAAEVFGSKQAKAVLPLIKEYEELDDTVKKFGFGSMAEVVEQGDQAAQTMHKFGLAVDVVERALGVGVIQISSFVAELAKTQPEIQLIISLFDRLDAQRKKNEQDAKNSPMYRELAAAQAVDKFQGQGLALRAGIQPRGIKDLESDQGRLENELQKQEEIRRQALQGNVGREGTQQALNKITEIHGEIDANKALIDSLKAVEEAKKRSIEDERNIQEKMAKLRTDVNFRLEHPYGINKIDEQIRGFAETRGITPQEIEQVTGILTPERIKLNKDLIAKAVAESRSTAKKIVDELNKTSKTSSAADTEFTKDLERKIKDEADQVKLYSGALMAQRKLEEAQDIGQNKLAGLGDDSAQARLQNEFNLIAIKKQYRTDEFNEELADAAVLHQDDVKRFGDNSRLEADQQEIKLKYQKDINDLNLQGQIAAGEEAKKQYESIKSEATKLYDVLFTHPKDFGKDLHNTIVSSIRKPIAEGLGGLTSKALSPLIYGQDGKGGIAGSLHGLFGGTDKLDPIKVTDANTLATKANTTSLDNLSAYLAASAGLPAPPRSTGGTSGGVGSVSLPGSTSGVSGAFAGIRAALPKGSIDGLLHTVFANGGGGSTNDGWSGSGSDRVDADGNPVFSVTGTGAGATGGISLGGGSTATGASVRAAGSSALGAVLKSLGGSDKGGSGFGGLLSGLKKTNWGKFSRNKDGRITGVNGVAGAALGAAGLSFAEKGLLGDDRGTGKGILEGSLGGAAIGMEYGGPLGAAIGAGVGLSIGLGEKLFGVESPVNEAKKLVKQKYQVTIDTQFAQKIVSLAQSKYGGKVSLAVLDPEIRNALMVYASGTGQKVPLSSSAPHAGSLVESGGQLQQQASYMFGQAYTYQSNLPTYGNVSSTTLPSSSPVNLSLHVDGSDTASFMTGNYVTPSFVNGQQSQANAYSVGRVQNSATYNAPLLYT